MNDHAGPACTNTIGPERDQPAGSATPTDASSPSAHPLATSGSPRRCAEVGLTGRSAGVRRLTGPGSAGPPATAAAGRRRGGADDQVRLELDLAVDVAGIGGGLLEEEFGGCPAEQVAGLPDRGERHGGRFG